MPHASSTEHRVLVLLPTYLPGYKGGGPIRSIANLVAALGADFHFRIVTSDRDLGDEDPFPCVAVNRWVRVGQADVLYLRPGLRGFLDLWLLLRSVREDSVLYINGFFPRRFSMLPVLMWWLKLCRPRSLVLAPRGEFSPGALRLKCVRKLLYIRVSRWLNLYCNLIWHASTDFEAVDIHRNFPSATHIETAAVVSGQTGGRNGNRSSEVITALDIAKAMEYQCRVRLPKMPGHLRAVFLSRVSPKKNLVGALRMLGGILGDVSFDIYGPAEDAEYWQECQRLIAALPANIRVRHRGDVIHDLVGETLAAHELFLFPTFGENYGHVICEALASGCPVLISDQTPWRNLEAEGVGWDIPLGDTERFRSVLQQCVDGDDEWHAALSTRAADYAAKHSGDPSIIDANSRLFQRAFARAGRALA
jgi:glycosyltransferase involved in cell wall biosynthesis